MFYTKLLTFSYFFSVSYCDWVTDWMSPVQDKIKNSASPRRFMNEDVERMVQVNPISAEAEPPEARNVPSSRGIISLKTRLEESLANAEDLIDRLQMQIGILERKEKILKDTIVNGRLGVTTVTVSTNKEAPRTYLIRDGSWSICNGMVQYPTAKKNSANMFNELFNAPRCIGQEIKTSQDPCTFNSIIKYETVPEHRKLEYTEDDFFCLKPSFNRSLEQFLSVPKRIINETCKEGTVRSLAENVQQCGLRMMSEYSYYPRRNTEASTLPLQYCVEKDGSCRLIVAWHVSNISMENFEFLKNEENFKKYFIKYGGQISVDHIL